MAKTTELTERIRCPRCAHEQDAKVTFYWWADWPSYVHPCVICEYIIMESEWEMVSHG